MDSQKTLNAKNIEALGTARLAELLLEVATGNASIKRRLRLELAGAAGPMEVSREVTKRLSTIARSRSFVEWDKAKSLLSDLGDQRRAIVEQIGKEDPGEALTLLWRLMALAGSIFERCDDSNGYVGDLFRSAARDLGPLAQQAKADPMKLASRAFEALQTNHYGEFDQLIEILAPQLGTSGLEHLKGLITAWAAEPRSKLEQGERRVIGWGSGRGAIYADEMEDRHRKSSVRMALEQIADSQGDVDGFIAQQDDRARKAPMVAAAIGRRLLDVGRPQEALNAIDAANVRGGSAVPEWEQARIDALVALGSPVEVQSFRWESFTRTLSANHLRAFLKKVPDFEDFDAEQRALDHASRADVHQALNFFVAWPALEQASKLVIDRIAELNGDRYELLTPAADELEGSFPLAATLIRRAMIDFTLDRAKATRYRHAARHLAECASLAVKIEDYGSFPDHDTYVGRLKIAHGRKAGFWQA